MGHQKVHLATNVCNRTLCGALVQPLSLAVNESGLVSAAGLAISNAETREDGERGRNRTFNLLIKSRQIRDPRFVRILHIFQPLTTTQARTEAFQSWY
jgi:hypothetical protein